MFFKGGISEDQQKSAQLDDDDPFKDLQNQIKKLGDFYTLNTTAEDAIFADQNVTTTVPLLSDDKLIKELMNVANEDADDGAVLDPVCPKIGDVREAL